MRILQLHQIVIVPIVGSSQQQVNGRTNCRISQVAPSTQRSAKEELGFYLDRVKGDQSFREFWNTYQNDLPRMIAVLRVYNMLSTEWDNI